MENRDEKKSVGYSYNVSEEQIREHQQRTVAEIFEWLETTNEFIYKMQTPEERERVRKIRRGEF